MPTLHPGSQRNVVFFSNIPVYTGHPSLALRRYNVETQTTTTILSLKGTNIATAQISDDGQWVLFIMQSSSSSAIELIRIDGKYLQTLYCAPQGQQIDPTSSTGMQWSPNQKLILFTQGANANVPLPIYLLNVINGNVQVEVKTTGQSFIQPHTWVDNTRIYVTSGPDVSSPPATMLMLDTSKGANQLASDLQVVLGVSDTLWDFDSNYDASKLFVVHYDPTVGRAGPGTFCQITSMSISGTNGKLIFTSNKLVVSGLRALGYGSSDLLLRVNQPGAPADQYNGIWRIHTDGSGLTRLTNLGGSFNQFTQYPWSNVSRDGSLYLVTNFFGPLSGGPITHYTSDGNTIPVGWTTI
jgi:Tol biopolymer transport system component